jgi:hypothetical protein
MIRRETLAGGGALFSDDGHHRFALWRRWAAGPLLPFLGLNPSTATEAEDDPTIRREVGFAKRAGAAGLLKLNLSPFRATKPRKLYALLGTTNEDRRLAFPDERLRAVHDLLVDQEDLGEHRIVAAFGGFAGAGVTARAYLAEEAASLYRCYVSRGFEFVALGETLAGWPRHPLYVRADAPLRDWFPPVSEEDDDG